jgi:hypothetical protein
MFKDIQSDVDEEVIFERSDEDMVSVTSNSLSEDSKKSSNVKSKDFSHSKLNINSKITQYRNIDEFKDTEFNKASSNDFDLDIKRSLQKKLSGVYKPFCLKTLHSYEFEKDDGLDFEYFVKKSNNEFLPSSEDELISNDSNNSDKNGNLILKFIIVQF